MLPYPSSPTESSDPVDLVALLYAQRRAAIQLLRSSEKALTALLGAKAPKPVPVEELPVIVQSQQTT